MFNVFGLKSRPWDPSAGSGREIAVNRIAPAEGKDFPFLDFSKLYITITEGMLFRFPACSGIIFPASARDEETDGFPSVPSKAAGEPPCLLLRRPGRI
ncbi:hypothetical protein RLV_4394 [Rhizobium leguminosarum bv. viciae]|nr:hypothetical protein RLV_4394 [Rhizobium leguminosarum bv. viciae]